MIYINVMIMWCVSVCLLLAVTLSVGKIFTSKNMSVCHEKWALFRNSLLTPPQAILGQGMLRHHQEQGICSSVALCLFNCFFTGSLGTPKSDNVVYGKKQLSDLDLPDLTGVQEVVCNGKFWLLESISETHQMAGALWNLQMVHWLQAKQPNNRVT